MRISWKHDYEEWDPFTLLGEVEIAENKGNRIQEDCIILDTWLVALAKGLLELRKGSDAVAVDTIDEPDELLFERQNDAVTIRWKDQFVAVPDLSAACEDLAVQLRKLASDLSSREEPRDEVGIQELEAYSRRLAN